MNSAWDSFLRWAAQGLSDLTASVFTAFSSSTSPRFDQQWWRENLGLMVTISLPLLVGLFVLQCISAAVRREPGRLGQALVGALIGTAGVPLAIAVIASCGRVADEVSLAILGNRATADGLKRMVDLGTVLSAGTLGGFLLFAVFLGLIATISLYGVMLLRDVAIVAFVVFAPIALASWTWSATRHWLRRWVEVVGALVFSKIAMAMIFALGISATGNADPGGKASVSTFLAGVLLLAMAALAPFATFTFIHWAGDQGQFAGWAIQQGAVGANAVKDRFDQAQQWRADHFGGSGDDGSEPVVGDEIDDASVARGHDDDPQSGTSPASSDVDSSQPEITVVTGPDAPTSPSDTSATTQSPAEPPSVPPTPASSGADPTVIASATSEASVEVGSRPGAPGNLDNDGSDH